jgi:soluble lytic murein transglycosylase-like protein
VIRGAAFLLVLGLAAPARATVYAYTDKDGTIHLTNIPDDPRYRPYPVEGKNNTFRWQDDIGKLRKVHRVDVDAYDLLIVEAAQYYTLPPALVKAVVAVESSFEPAAVSHAGAQGLMQLIPRTARQMQVRDPFDPRDNIYGGARYLRVLANEFPGSVPLTVAAYNAGPERVTRAGGVPRIPETQTYVRRVLTLYKHYLKTWDPGDR